MVGLKRCNLPHLGTVSMSSHFMMKYCACMFDKKLPISVSFKEGPEIRAFLHLTQKKWYIPVLLPYKGAEML